MSAPLWTGPEFALGCCVLIVVACAIAGIAKRVNRLPSCPPMYDYLDDEVLPEPEIRARVRRIDPDREWIIEEKA